MVRKEYAEWIEYQLIQLASSGQLKIPLSDEDFKRMILNTQENKEIKIRRKYEKTC
jgi:DNA-binding TFAR19-related protein (PDSD5 family)